METAISRPFYLEQLIESKDSNICKVVTGMRRSGKSFLLFNLYAEWLKENGVKRQRA